MNLSDIKTIARKGMTYYPKKCERKQWVKKTVELIESGKHMLINGKFPQKMH